MKRRAWIPFVVAVLVVVAGCNALGGSGAGTETPTITPVAVPTDQPTSTSVPLLAPGLSPNGVVSTVALRDAHEAALGNRSFTVVSNETVTYANGTLRFRSSRTARVENATGAFYSVQEFDRSGLELPAVLPEHVEIWSDGEGVALKQGTDETYRPSRSATRSSFDFRNGDEFYALFHAFDVRVITQETDDGTERYRLRATELAEPAYLPTSAIGIAENPRNVEFRAVVDSRGVVRWYHLAYTATDTRTATNTTNRIVRSVRYSRIGSTVVERPAWYTPKNRTTTTAG